MIRTADVLRLVTADVLLQVGGVFIVAQGDTVDAVQIYGGGGIRLRGIALPATEIIVQDLDILAGVDIDRIGRGTIDDLVVLDGDVIIQQVIIGIRRGTQAQNGDGAVIVHVFKISGILDQVLFNGQMLTDAGLTPIDLIMDGNGAHPDVDQRAVLDRGIRGLDQQAAGADALDHRVIKQEAIGGHAHVIDQDLAGGDVRVIIQVIFCQRVGVKFVLLRVDRDGVDIVCARARHSGRIFGILLDHAVGPCFLLLRGGRCYAIIDQLPGSGVDIHTVPYAERIAETAEFDSLLRNNMLITVLRHIPLIGQGHGAVLIVLVTSQAGVGRILVRAVITHVLKPAGDDPGTYCTLGGMGRIDGADVGRRTTVAALIIRRDLKIYPVCFLPRFVRVISPFVNDLPVTGTVIDAIVGSRTGVVELRKGEAGGTAIDRHILEADIGRSLDRCRRPAVACPAGQDVSLYDGVVLLCIAHRDGHGAVIILLHAFEAGIHIGIVGACMLGAYAGRIVMLFSLR